MKVDALLFDKKLIVAALVYFSVSSFLVFKSGIHLTGEAEKFIENANHMLNGEALFNGVFGYFYIAYILLIALFLKLSVNLVIVAFLQIVLSFIAAVCLYKLLLQGLNNRNVAFLFFLAYLLCYPIQKWNYFLYSESVHTSLIVIGIYLFDKSMRFKGNFRLVLLMTVLLLILITRPVGVIFLVALFIVMLFWLYRNKRMFQFYALATISLVSILLILNSPLTAFVNPDSIRRMEVICQVPETNKAAYYQEYNRSGLFAAFAVIKDEVGFGEFFKIGFKKLGYFFGMWRSYYSWQHNLMLICFTFVYPLALIGSFSKKQHAFFYIKLFALFYLGITTIGIFFTCDEWSNRFISPAFPFVLILAALGLLGILEKYRSRNLNGSTY